MKTGLSFTLSTRDTSSTVAPQKERESPINAGLVAPVAHWEG